MSQQFRYQLQDLELVRRSEPPKPDGKLVVHLTDFQCVEVEYHRRETIEQFRDRLQAAVPHLTISEYYLVSEHGSIEDGMTLDEYFLTPGSRILIVRKGIKTRQILANRNYWLKSRAAALLGKPRPVLAMQRIASSQKSHHVTPYRRADQRSSLPPLGK
jgi:hypothetical protein